MAINRVDYPTSLTDQSDFTAHGELIETRYMDQVSPSQWVVSGNIPQGVVFQIGGTVYRADSDTAITGTASDYVKIVPDGATATAEYASSLIGVAWSSQYNGYYDGSSNLVVFDEGKALAAGQISAVFSRYLMQQPNGDVQVGRNLTVDGTLDAGGNTTVGGTLGVTGNTTVGGTLGVTGNTTVGGTLDVDGTSQLDGLNVDGSTTLDGTTINGTLDVNGSADISGGVDAGGNSTIGGTLVVSGRLTANDGATVVGTLGADILSSGNVVVSTTSTASVGASTPGTPGQFYTRDTSVSAQDKRAQVYFCRRADLSVFPPVYYWVFIA